MVPVQGEDREESEPDGEKVQPHEAVVLLFETLIPQNIFNALAEDTLLSVMVVSIIVGYLLKRDSPIFVSTILLLLRSFVFWNALECITLGSVTGG